MMSVPGGGTLARVTFVAALALAGCAVGSGPGTVREGMLTHFDMAAEMREAALRGDSSGARRAANRLADLERPPDLGSELAPQFLPLTRAAREVGRAQSAEETARAAAQVARACADCHVANRVGLGDRLGASPAPARADHGAESTRAAGLLWNGVAGPSDPLWSTGATALAAAAPPPQAPAGRLPAGYADEAALRLGQLAREASVVTAPEERDRLLADLWATCADCHTRIR
jgi:cytochrome c553